MGIAFFGNASEAAVLKNFLTAAGTLTMHLAKASSTGHTNSAGIDLGVFTEADYTGYAAQDFAFTTVTPDVAGNAETDEVVLTFPGPTDSVAQDIAAYYVTFSGVDGTTLLLFKVFSPDSRTLTTVDDQVVVGLKLSWFDPNLLDA